MARLSPSDSAPTASEASVVHKIPGVVKRNTILLALSQALVGAATQMIPALGAILVVQLTGSANLAGIGTTMIAVSRFVIAYPLGKIMDIYGRRTGLILGLALGVVGALLTGSAVIWHSFPTLLAGMLIFGLGAAAAQQLRLAAADMYPPSRRAEGLGYVLTGTLVGALGGPLIVSLAQALSPSVHIDALALPWLIVPAVMLPSIVLLFQLRPDPKEIAAHLERYYPGYVAPSPTHPDLGGQASVAGFLRHYPKLVAFVASMAVQGNMMMIMAMTSLVLSHHGHALPAISLSVAIHVIGMYALSLPLGRLSDVVGRRIVLLTGVLTAATGAVLVPLTADYWIVTAGTFLVGVGWSCVNVAATAVLADTTMPLQRGRAIGINDTLSNGVGIIPPLIAGPMAELLGMGSIGVLGALLMLPPLVLLLRLREPRPGKYT